MRIVTVLCLISLLYVALGRIHPAADGAVSGREPGTAKSGTPPAPPLLHAGDSLRGVRLVASVEPMYGGIFRPLQAINVQVTLKNTTSFPVVIIENYEVEDWDLVVKDRAGHVMPLTRYGTKPPFHEVFSGGTTILGAGRERHFYVTVNRLVDMTVATTYSVTIKRTLSTLAVTKGRPIMKRGAYFEVASNPVVVRVTGNVIGA